jgi:hypothetical protein
VADVSALQKIMLTVYKRFTTVNERNNCLLTVNKTVSI